MAIHHNGKGEPKEILGLSGYVLPYDFPKAKDAPNGWRDVRPGEVFEQGRHFRMNQTDGTTQVYDPAVAWSARGQDGEPVVALINLWAEIDGNGRAVARKVAENYFGQPHMLPWWGEKQTAMISVTIYAPESAIGVYNVKLQRTVTASVTRHA